jgi:hypothetical protein
MTRYLIILFSIILMSCNNDSTKLIIGRYTSVRPSYIYMYFQFFTNGIRSFAVGSELILKTDSNFVYTTCGNIKTGKWKINSDSLFLKIESNNFRNDSLNIHGLNGKFPIVPQEPIVMVISGIELIHFIERMDKTKSNEETNSNKSLEILVNNPDTISQ